MTATTTPPSVSPFITHRAVILSRYGAATTLQDLTMSMWNGSDYPVSLSRFGAFDSTHCAIALEMICWYATHGENDPAFMQIALDILAQRETFATAVAETERLESNH